MVRTLQGSKLQATDLTQLLVDPAAALAAGLAVSQQQCSLWSKRWGQQQAKQQARLESRQQSQQQQGLTSQQPQQPSTQQPSTQAASQGTTSRPQQSRSRSGSDPHRQTGSSLVVGFMLRLTSGEGQPGHAGCAGHVLELSSHPVLPEGPPADVARVVLQAEQLARWVPSGRLRTCPGPLSCLDGQQRAAG